MDGEAPQMFPLNRCARTATEGTHATMTAVPAAALPSVVGPPGSRLVTGAIGTGFRILFLILVAAGYAIYDVGG
ncbi:hypothetical protein BAY59_31135 [Prauserella coralliicola]|nr:hypothetical protein BAY59_31135 [Prauserella coralliicola]